VTVSAGAAVDRSVLGAGVTVGAGAHICDSIVAERARIGTGAVLEHGTVIGPGEEVPAGRRLTGARVPTSRP
jgi:NDP-sugar pyrophosphorylase family protein